MKFFLSHSSNIDFDFPIKTNGKSGIGFYAYKSSSSAMRNYYQGLYEYKFEVDSDVLLDLTTTNNYLHCKAYIEKQLGKKITKSIFQSSGIYINSYMDKFYPEKKGFINFHFGFGLPNSKEYVITDLSCIENLKKISN